MGPFDSIKMGQRCKGWLSQADAPSYPEDLSSKGTSVGGKQWILNACICLKDKMERSAVVFDGGPRWVLSTALGFVFGGVWWTIIYAALFAVANYAMYVNTVPRSETDWAGIGAYSILAAALSLASVPGPSCFSDWKGLATGLGVEVFLCVCVIVSAGVVHNFFGDSLTEHPGLSNWADLGRWTAPASVWVAASMLREKATHQIRIKLRDLWCCHPMCDSADRLGPEAFPPMWDEWAAAVQKCARRVGGYGMLGFSGSDLDVLSASFPTPKALEEIQRLRISLPEDGSTTEPWVKQSSALLAGYDTRLKTTKPESSVAIIPIDHVPRLIRFLMSGVHPEVESYKKEIEGSEWQARYGVRIDDSDVDHWFYAGALLADSDYRERDPLVRVGVASDLKHRTYGSRLAVSISLLVEGTDPLARLACYPDMKMPKSSVKLLSSAISKSAKALVFDLAYSAGVEVDVDALGERGLAYVKCGTNGAKSLSYSPDELAAAAHREETIMISDDTFLKGPGTNPQLDIFEKLWGGSADVKKTVDVQDMVPLAASRSEAGASAFLGWMCHLGFTLAVLTVFLVGSSSHMIFVLFLVFVPATNKRVSIHMNSHYFMIYISYILNYARSVSRWSSLSQRGKATLDKAKYLREIVFLFVNVMPVLAFFVFEKWAWWICFIPCMLANLPGLLNTIIYGWPSAFEYEWWSWHVPNRWFSGRGYLEVAVLRARVGRNVLFVSGGNDPREVTHVTPEFGSVTSRMRFVVVGGGRCPALCP